MSALAWVFIILVVGFGCGFGYFCVWMHCSSSSNQNVPRIFRRKKDDESRHLVTEDPSRPNQLQSEPSLIVKKVQNEPDNKISSFSEQSDHEDEYNDSCDDVSPPLVNIESSSNDINQTFVSSSKLSSTNDLGVSEVIHSGIHLKNEAIHRFEENAMLKNLQFLKSTEDSIVTNRDLDEFIEKRIEDSKSISDAPVQISTKLDQSYRSESEIENNPPIHSSNTKEKSFSSQYNVVKESKNESVEIAGKMNEKRDNNIETTKDKNLDESNISIQKTTQKSSIPLQKIDDSLVSESNRHRSQEYLQTSTEEIKSDKVTSQDEMKGKFNISVESHDDVFESKLKERIKTDEYLEKEEEILNLSSKVNLMAQNPKSEKNKKEKAYSTIDETDTSCIYKVSPGKNIEEPIQMDAAERYFASLLGENQEEPMIVESKAYSCGSGIERENIDNEQESSSRSSIIPKDNILEKETIEPISKFVDNILSSAKETFEKSFLSSSFGKEDGHQNFDVTKSQETQKDKDEDEEKTSYSLSTTLDNSESSLQNSENDSLSLHSKKLILSSNSSNVPKDEEENKKEFSTTSLSTMVHSIIDSAKEIAMNQTSANNSSLLSSKVNEIESSSSSHSGIKLGEKTFDTNVKDGTNEMKSIKNESETTISQNLVPTLPKMISQTDNTHESQKSNVPFVMVKSDENKGINDVAISQSMEKKQMSKSSEIESPSLTEENKGKSVVEPLCIKKTAYLCGADSCSSENSSRSESPSLVKESQDCLPKLVKEEL